MNSTGGMNSTSTMTTMMMTPWLHFGGEDYLIFKAWQPRSNGAIAGACIALIAFCILERWVASLRRQWEILWSSRLAGPKVQQG
jgi:copper transporter 1